MIIIISSLLWAVPVNAGLMGKYTIKMCSHARTKIAHNIIFNPVGPLKYEMVDGLFCENSIIIYKII